MSGAVGVSEPTSGAQVAVVATNGVFHDVEGRAAIEAEGSSAPKPEPYVSPHLPPLAGVLVNAVERAHRRATGVEYPIPLRWPILSPHFAGGLWPGFHILVSTTGVGKTAFALQQAVHAAGNGCPVAYVGLELRLDEAGMRLLGDPIGIPWSKLYTGQATGHELDLARSAMVELTRRDLPLHIIPRRAHGWPASKLASVAEEMRKQYPEPHGPGSRPIFIALDFLQLVGRELVPCGRCRPCRAGDMESCPKPVPDSLDLRERIAQASYVGHEVAERFGAVVLAIASVSREKYNLWKLVEQAGLTWKDGGGFPADRGVGNPDALVGAGKESGEIEYSADSVSAIVRVPGTWSGAGCEVVFATVKGRATGATWSPLRFTGFGYVDSADGGASVVAALEEKETKQEEKRAKKQEDRSARETKKAEERTSREAERAKRETERIARQAREAERRATDREQKDAERTAREKQRVERETAERAKKEADRVAREKKKADQQAALEAERRKKRAAEDAERVAKDDDAARAILKEHGEAITSRDWYTEMRLRLGRCSSERADDARKRVRR